MRLIFVLMCLLLSPLVLANYDGTNQLISSNQLLKNKHNYVILDVRSADEFAQGHIEGAINIPHYAVLDHINQLKDIEKPIVVHCRSGKRAWKAEQMLMDNQVTNLLHLQGDMLEWVDKSLPLKASK